VTARARVGAPTRGSRYPERVKSLSKPNAKAATKGQPSDREVLRHLTTGARCLKHICDRGRPAAVSHHGADAEMPGNVQAAVGAHVEAPCRIGCLAMTDACHANRVGRRIRAFRVLHVGDHLLVHPDHRRSGEQPNAAPLEVDEVRRLEVDSGFCVRQ